MNLSGRGGYDADPHGGHARVHADAGDVLHPRPGASALFFFGQRVETLRFGFGFAWVWV